MANIILVLCANASGDCKINQLLIYHIKNHTAFKENEFVKDNLNIEMVT